MPRQAIDRDWPDKRLRQLPDPDFHPFQVRQQQTVSLYSLIGTEGHNILAAWSFPQESRPEHSQVSDFHASRVKLTQEARSQRSEVGGQRSQRSED